MSNKAEIWARLAEMINECSEHVKICVPSTDYYGRAGDFSEDRIVIIDKRRLIGMLEAEAAMEE